MGCCESSCWRESPLSHKDQNHGQTQTYPSNGTTPGAAAVDGAGGILTFSEFSLSDLKAATNNFSPEFIVSESGEKAPNVVYKGRLQNRRWIAIKKFSKMAWPDPKQFADEAWGVGKLRYKRLANLIGYCCDGDKRLLVAGYMPNGTLAKHLFHSEFKAMQAQAETGGIPVELGRIINLDTLHCQTEKLKFLYIELLQINLNLVEWQWLNKECSKMLLYQVLVLLDWLMQMQE